MGSVFDIGRDYDQPVFTGTDGFEKNCEYCRHLMEGSADILMRLFVSGNGRRCAVLMIDGMSNKELVEQDVILSARRYMGSTSGDALQMFGSSEAKREKSLSKAYISVLTGDAMVIVDGEPEVFVFGYRFITSRSISDSPNDGSVIGPHEAFSENLRFNTALIRRRISDPNMVVEHLSVGQRSHTTVALFYIRGVTNKQLVSSIREQINSINIDIINDSGELEQLIEPQPHNLFPQTGSSELPDVAAAAVCSGRIVLIVNGSPRALILPETLSGMMSAGEDNYKRFTVASYTRLLRWVCAAVALIGPALYVAMVSYHPGLLPTDLMLLTAKNRADVPFSAFIEVLIIEFALEVLREAAVRMPKNIGTALSIVGGLIIGDAAISAGLISPFLIIIIGLTTICGFVIPSYPFASALRLAKYGVLVMTAVLGLPGLTAGVLLTLSMLTATRSSHLDFTAPFSPLRGGGVIKALTKQPADKRKYRPYFLDVQDTIRYSG